MIDHDSVIREDVQHARFDFERDAFIIPAATADDELLDVIGDVTEDVLAAYTAITQAVPEEFRKLAEAHFGAKVGAQ